MPTMPGRGYAARKVSQRKGTGNTDERLESTRYRWADRRNKKDPPNGHVQAPPPPGTTGSCLPYWEGKGGDELRTGFAWRAPRFLRGKAGPGQGLTSS